MLGLSELVQRLFTNKDTDNDAARSKSSHVQSIEHSASVRSAAGSISTPSESSALSGNTAVTARAALSISTLVSLSSAVRMLSSILSSTSFHASCTQSHSDRPVVSAEQLAHTALNQLFECNLFSTLVQLLDAIAGFVEQHVQVRIATIDT